MKPASARKRWRQWAQLDVQQQKLFLSALLLLPVMGALLRAFRYRDIYRRLKIFVPLRERTNQIDVLSRGIETAAIVEIAARRRVAKTTCLRRSLVLWVLLRRQGIESDLRLGVHKQHGKLSGHAWVEIAGAVINDEAEVAAQYTVIDLGDQA